MSAAPIREVLIPRNPSLRAAYQRGYDARLRGCSRYSTPYDPDAPGWTGAFGHAWLDGWETADDQVPPWTGPITIDEPEEVAA